MDAYRRGEFMSRILQCLHRHEATVSDIADYIFTPGFGHKGSKSRAQKNSLSLRRVDRHQQASAAVRGLRDKQRLRSLLYYLKKQGLIARKVKHGMRPVFGLTAAGKDKKGIMAATAWRRTLSPDYETEPADAITVVIFDIPERYRPQRAWLRSALRTMKFVLIQKSTWAARLKLPPAFMHDLQTIGILPHVLIMSTSPDGMIGDLV